jgi:ABC-2 type transport system permease protein
MISLLRLYLNGIRLSFLTRMAERMDFLASLLVMLGIELLPSLITVLVYGQGLAFPGWTLHQAILVQGVFLVAKGLTFPMFAGMAWAVTEKVREGTFELILLKPRHPLVMCIVTGFDAEDVGKLFGGLALTTFALGHAGIPDPAGLALGLFLLAFSVVFFAAGLIFMTSLLMVWVGNGRMYELFDTLTSLGQYPPVMLPPRIRRFALAPVPLLGMAVLPASALLGRGIEGWPWAAACSLLFFAASVAFWNHLIKRASSAGG